MCPNTGIIVNNDAICLCGDSPPERVTVVPSAVVVVVVVVYSILLPGGRASIISSPFQRASQIFYELAVEVRVVRYLWLCVFVLDYAADSCCCCCCCFRPTTGATTSPCGEPVLALSSCFI